MVYVLHQPPYNVWFFVTSAFFSILSWPCHADISMYRVNTNQQIDGGYRTYKTEVGPNLEPEGFEGFVVYNVRDGTGCNSSLVDFPPNEMANRRFILLLQRGNCSFVDKVLNAQLKQYDMVIVFNNISSVELMHVETIDEILIPSVIVSHSTGLALKNKYQYFNNVYVVVEVSYNPFDFNNNLLVPFAIIVSVFFIVMISFTICKCIRDRRRNRRHRLPASSLRKIPIEKFSSKTCRYETCAICLDDYVDGEKLRVLPCFHAYHTKCIDPWLTRNRRVCPICKRKVFAINEVPIEGSDSDSDSDNDERTPLVRPESSLQDVQTRRALISSLFVPLSGNDNQERTSSVIPVTPQEVQRRTFISSILGPLTNYAWQSHDSPPSSDVSNSSPNGSLLSIYLDPETNEQMVVPASTICSINSHDNNGSTSTVLNSRNFPGTSSVQLPHRSNRNVQNRNNVSS